MIRNQELRNTPREISRQTQAIHTRQATQTRLSRQKQTKQKRTKQKRTKQIDLHTNRCERCNRKLKDSSAKFGWRCAEILGTTQSLNRAGDGAFNDYRLGVENAGRYLRENKIDMEYL